MQPLNQTRSPSDRRAHARRALDVAASLWIRGENRAGRILDFCPGGIFAAVDGADGDHLVMGARQVGRGDAVTIIFQTGAAGGAVLQVGGKVARVFGDGVGIAFVDPGPDALDALTRAAAAVLQSDGPVAGSELNAPARATVSRRLRQLTKQFVDDAGGDIGETAADELVKAAREASSNYDFVEANDALKELQGLRQSVADGFAAGVLAGIDALESAGPASRSGSESDVTTDTGELSLVDTGTFDDWLSAKKVVAAATPRFADTQAILDLRLSVLAGQRIAADDNPIGVAGLGFAFHDALQNLGAGRRVRAALLDAFATVVFGRLGAFLAHVLELLEEAGIDVTPDKPRITRQRRAEAPPPRSEAATPEPEPEPAPESDTPPAGAVPPHPHPPATAYRGQPPGAVGHPPPAPGAPMPQTPPMAPPRAAGWAPASSAPASPSWAEPGAAPPPGSFRQAPPGPPTAAPPRAWAGAGYYPPSYTSSDQVPLGDALGTASWLHGLRRHVASGVAEPMGGLHQRLTFGSDAAAIARVLERLQHDPRLSDLADSGPLQLRERLEQALGDEPEPVAEDEASAVGVVADLFESILGDPLVGRGVKARLRQLAVPLLRVAVREDAFLQDQAHPARQVVNRLGRIQLPAERAPGYEGATLRDDVDPLVERIVREHERDHGVFANVLPRLDELLDRQRDAYRERVESLARARDEQATLMRRLRGGAAPTATRDAPPELKRWLDRAGHVHRGDLLAVKGPDGSQRALSVAWVDTDGANFLLADAQGNRAATFSRQELAMGLRRGDVTKIDAPELPLVDRGMYKLLEGMHEALADEANRDGLTGLANRTALERRLGHLLEHAGDAAERPVVCVLDIDGFGAINARCGQRAGDSLLRKMARVVERHAGSRGMTARLGDDDFAVLLEGTTAEGAREFAERLRFAISDSRCVYRGEEIPLSASIAVAVAAAEETDARHLLGLAETSVAEAARLGGNRVVEASAPEPRTETAGLLALLRGERLALRAQRVEPLTTGDGGRPHFEILLGVRDDSGIEPVPPGLIQAAERDGTMREVDRWVVSTALRWMAANRRKVAQAGGYSVNLSGLSLSDEDLLAFVMGLLEETRVPPGKVIFEVTETAAIDGLSHAVTFIRTLREYGCRFSLDDFGAGHASYSYLKTLPVDYLKIDGLFVREIHANPADRAMVQSMHDIARVLGKQTIAEFAESEAIIEVLRGIGIDYVQGYAGARPVAIDAA
ncbi:MAG: DUF1631 family protein [Ectothiorhodospiraceae bacterium]|nr:DUF1631 family protein [Chromatiales bacterium]MCP5157073.1 DUF1631 family protein [Ectothiorhodospiraceae bacterium]